MSISTGLRQEETRRSRQERRGNFSPFIGNNVRIQFGQLDPNIQQTDQGELPQTLENILKNLEYEDLPEETFPTALVCIICHRAFHNPMMITNCGHIFCKTCLDKSINLRNICPICIQVPQSIIPGPFAIKQQLDEIKCKCTYCEWIGERQFYVGHLKSTCYEILLICPNECGNICKRKEMETHQTECSYREISCSCNQKMKFYQLEEHLKSDCKSVKERIRDNPEVNEDIKFLLAQLASANTKLTERIEQVERQNIQLEQQNKQIQQQLRHQICLNISKTIPEIFTEIYNTVAALSNHLHYRNRTTNFGFSGGSGFSRGGSISELPLSKEKSETVTKFCSTFQTVNANIVKIMKSWDFLLINIDPEKFDKNKELWFKILEEIKSLIQYFDPIIAEKEFLEKVYINQGTSVHLTLDCRERLIRHRDFLLDLIRDIQNLI